MTLLCFSVSLFCLRRPAISSSIIVWVVAWVAPGVRLFLHLPSKVYLSSCSETSVSLGSVSPSSQLMCFRGVAEKTMPGSGSVAVCH